MVTFGALLNGQVVDRTKPCVTKEEDSCPQKALGFFSRGFFGFRSFVGQIRVEGGEEEEFKVAVLRCEAFVLRQSYRKGRESQAKCQFARKHVEAFWGPNSILKMPATGGGNGRRGSRAEASEGPAKYGVRSQARCS